MSPKSSTRRPPRGKAGQKPAQPESQTPLDPELFARNMLEVGLRTQKALAEMALLENNFEAAQKYAKLTLHIDVLDAEVHRILGEACKGLKDNKRAIEELETALELKPKEVDIQLGLAEAYLAVDRNGDAKKLIDEVLKKDAGKERAKELSGRVK